MRKTASVVQKLMLSGGVCVVASGWMALGCTGSIGLIGDVGGAGGDGNGDPENSPSNGGNGGDVVVRPPLGGMGDSEPFVFTRPSFSCDRSQSPESIGLRKLTTEQYKNTLRDLIGFALGGNAAQAMSVWNAIGPALDRYPNDERALLGKDPAYRQMNQAQQQQHVEESYAIALAVASQLTQSTRLGTVAGACATDGNTANDAQCITDFINRFGERALRRPLTSEEVTFYRSFYGNDTASNPAAWADLIAGFLTAPQFLYFVEHGDTQVSGKDSTYRLSAFELASRLSYHFTQTMPDDALWQAARSGALLDEAEYARQVDRLLSKPEARRFTREFFEDYLRLADVDAMDRNRNDAKFRTFAGNRLPSSMLRQSMIDDALDMAQWYTWNRENGSFNGLLTGQEAFPRSQELADIYGVPVWDGTSEPPLFPADQRRHGIFTHAAFTATGMATTRPIIKGAHLRITWLCDEVPPPDAGAANTEVDTTNRTTRQAVEAITEQDGTSCKGCHQLYTNPLGFATEHFDGLGRYRTEEMLFDGSRHTGMAAVNATTQPQVHAGDPMIVDNAAELMALVVESGKPQACLARHYFRYTFARTEDLQRDGCLLERLRAEILPDNSTLKGMFRAVAMSEEFRQRRIAQ